MEIIIFLGIAIFAGVMAVKGFKNMPKKFENIRRGEINSIISNNLSCSDEDWENSLKVKSFNADKIVKYGDFAAFVIDNTQKEFALARYTVNSESLIQSLLNVQRNELDYYRANGKAFSEYAKQYINFNLSQRFKYNDIIKYEVVDKTEVNKPFNPRYSMPNVYINNVLTANGISKLIILLISPKRTFLFAFLARPVFIISLYNYSKRH